MNERTNTTHGPGAAHIGFSMFGARGPLLSSADDGNGAGAGGGESTTTTTTTATSAAASSTGTAPAAGSEKLLPQSQVNELVAKARREGRESALREGTQQTQQPPAPKPNAPKGEPGSMSADDVQQLIARDRAFTRIAATAGLNDRQLERMEAALRAENPADVTAWATSWIADMGLGVKTQTTTTTPATPPAPAAPNAPAKVDPITSGGLVDIWNLSPDQIETLGPAGLRAEHEKILNAASKRSGAPPIPSATLKR